MRPLLRPLLCLSLGLVVLSAGCPAEKGAAPPSPVIADGGVAGDAGSAGAAAAAACASDAEEGPPPVPCRLPADLKPQNESVLLAALLSRADERNRQGLKLRSDAPVRGKLPSAGSSVSSPAPPSQAAEAAACSGLNDPNDEAVPLFREALSCTGMALRLKPSSLVILRQRGIAQRELGQVEEARDTLTRALAVAPDDPALLSAAADLYISHLSATREHSEIGLLYAERGRSKLLTAAGQGPSSSADTKGKKASQRQAAKTRGGLAAETRELLAQLWLYSGQALLDLGRASQALPALDQALRLHELPEARYERAVALFELCRFREAQTAFNDLLAFAPSGRKAAWSHYHLGLLLEQLGQNDEAERELSAARTLLPEHFPEPLAVSQAEFTAMVRGESATLSADSAADLKRVRLELSDIPDPRDLTLESPPLSPTILGLFRGLPLGDEPSEPRSIVLYRKNLLRAVRSRAELSREIKKTLLHELGHLHGADEDDLRDEGLE